MISLRKMIWILLFGLSPGILFFGQELRAGQPNGEGICPDDHVCCPPTSNAWPDAENNGGKWCVSKADIKFNIEASEEAAEDESESDNIDIEVKVTDYQNSRFDITRPYNPTTGVSVYLSSDPDHPINDIGSFDATIRNDRSFPVEPNGANVGIPLATFKLELDPTLEEQTTAGTLRFVKKNVDVSQITNGDIKAVRWVVVLKYDVGGFNWITGIAHFPVIPTTRIDVYNGKISGGDACTKIISKEIKTFSPDQVPNGYGAVIADPFAHPLISTYTLHQYCRVKLDTPKQVCINTPPLSQPLVYYLEKYPPIWVLPGLDNNGDETLLNTMPQTPTSCFSIPVEFQERKDNFLSNGKIRVVAKPRRKPLFIVRGGTISGCDGPLTITHGRVIPDGVGGILYTQDWYRSEVCYQTPDTEICALSHEDSDPSIYYYEGYDARFPTLAYDFEKYEHFFNKWLSPPTNETNRQYCVTMPITPVSLEGDYYRRKNFTLTNINITDPDKKDYACSPITTVISFGSEEWNCPPNGRKSMSCRFSRNMHLTFEPDIPIITRGMENYRGNPIPDNYNQKIVLIPGQINPKQVHTTSDPYNLAWDTEPNIPNENPIESFLTFQIDSPTPQGWVKISHNRNVENISEPSDDYVPICENSPISPFADEPADGARKSFFKKNSAVQMKFNTAFPENPSIIELPKFCSLTIGSLTVLENPRTFLASDPVDVGATAVGPNEDCPPLPQNNRGRMVVGHGIQIGEGENKGSPLPDEGQDIEIEFGKDAPVNNRSLRITSAETKKIMLSSLPFGAKDPTLYFLNKHNDWEKVVQQSFNGNTLKAHIVTYGIYQVFAINTPDPELTPHPQNIAFGEVYVFPNPVQGEGVKTATLHVEVDQADRLSTRIYDVAGDLVYETAVESMPTVVGSKLVYEIPLPKEKFKPAVYIGAVTAEKGGQSTNRKTYRFTVQ